MPAKSQQGPEDPCPRVDTVFELNEFELALIECEEEQALFAMIDERPHGRGEHSFKLNDTDKPTIGYFCRIRSELKSASNSPIVCWISSGCRKRRFELTV